MSWRYREGDYLLDDQPVKVFKIEGTGWFYVATDGGKPNATACELTRHIWSTLKDSPTTDRLIKG